MLVSLGERPQLSYRPGVRQERHHAFTENLARLDVIWREQQLCAPFFLVARLDSSGIDPQLHRFLFRVGLVALAVALTLTVVTMVILGLTVLALILELRPRLVAG